MPIPATSIGEAVPRENFDAVIQSAFESAVNLRLANEDRLITLLISDHYELPQGIRIETKHSFLRSLLPGLRSAQRGGILRFDSSSLSIDLRAASVWKCRVAELHINMESVRSQQAWSTAWQLLNEGQRYKNTELVADDLFLLNSGSPLSQKMSRPVMQLVTSTERFDVQNSILGAKKMIGLGPGVTPSGDDFLVGFLAGLWSTAGTDRGPLSFIASFGKTLMEVAKQTNEISRTYLYHAVRGQFSSSLSVFLEAIATGQDVEQAVQETMAVGHSSGMDSVTGLLIGLAVWNVATIPQPISLS
jgi:hypothetical protein